MPKRQSALPSIWLVSDARNDAVLERTLASLPRGSGLVFRHYHLPPAERRARFVQLTREARRRGHWVALSGTVREARRWGTDAAYGSPESLTRGPAFLRLITAHGLTELAKANRARAGAIFLSPVFATRSHPGAKTLGPVRFRLLSALSQAPIVALGGMNRKRGKTLRSMAWAAVDGLIPGSRLVGIAQDS